MITISRSEDGGVTATCPAEDGELTAELLTRLGHCLAATGGLVVTLQLTPEPGDADRHGVTTAVTTHLPTEENP